jgi:prevent-host-death family protein
MSLSEQIKPISYLKSHAADIVKGFSDNPESIIITQNGEAKMVVMAIEAYERQQDTMALLKLLSLGKKEFQEGKFQSADQFFDEMDAQENKRDTHVGAHPRHCEFPESD